MKIFSKKFFFLWLILIIIRAANLSGMSSMQFPKGLNENYKEYTVIDQDEIKSVRKYYKPTLRFLGLPLMQHSYKRNWFHAGGAIGPAKTFYDENRYELCKITKVLLGALATGSIIGTAYYFDFFRKK